MIRTFKDGAEVTYLRTEITTGEKRAMRIEVSDSDADSLREQLGVKNEPRGINFKNFIYAKNNQLSNDKIIISQSQVPLI